MNMRLLGVTVIVLVVIAGLVAGIFAGAIQHALMIPATGSLTTGPIRIVQSMPGQTAPTATTAATSQTLAMDNFNRPNRVLWGTASDFQTWSGDANTQNQIFSIVGGSGQIAHSQGQQTFNALLGPNKNNVQVLLQGTINQFAANGNSNIGAVLRWSDINNWYKAFIDGANLSIIKRVNGNQVTLGTVPFNAQGNTMYSLRFQAVGATLYAKAWQSTMPEPADWMLTATDTDLASGQAGVRVLVQADTIINIKMFQVQMASTVM
jgi:hypothetical protein